jgi:pSer/pThr/pTyr-binding forkhead associated (FHA) protein
MAIVLVISVVNGPIIDLPVLGKVTLGRSRICDYQIDDNKMSGQHGSFELNEMGQLIYTDLNSTNGSFLNDNKIQKIHFKIGETLQLGNTLITIDEQKLNPRERIALSTAPNNSAEKTIATSSVKISKDEIKESKKAKFLVLNKDHKVNSISSTEGLEGSKLIEKEVSTGHTKSLKLSISKLNSKTKKK